MNANFVRFTTVLWLPAAVCLLGCDPIRTTTQQVRLSVVHANSRDPVQGVEVRLKYDFDSRPREYPDTAPKHVWDEHDRKLWEQSEWFSGVTNENGETTIRISYTGIDGTRGNRPPPNRDEVTGRQYIVIVNSDHLEEQLKIIMQDETTANGKLYNITVIEVSDVTYSE